LILIRVIHIYTHIYAYHTIYLVYAHHILILIRVIHIYTHIFTYHIYTHITYTYIRVSYIIYAYHIHIYTHIAHIFGIRTYVHSIYTYIRIFGIWYTHVYAYHIFGIYLVYLVYAYHVSGIQKTYIFAHRYVVNTTLHTRTLFIRVLHTHMYTMCSVHVYIIHPQIHCD